MWFILKQRRRVVTCANSQRGFVPPVDVCEFKNEKITFLDLNKQHDLI
jgi:hypothetical protein